MVQLVPRQPKLNFGQHMISTKIPGKQKIHAIMEFLATEQL
jgi:hypothetical protein